MLEIIDVDFNNPEHGRQVRADNTPGPGRQPLPAHARHAGPPPHGARGRPREAAGPCPRPRCPLMLEIIDVDFNNPEHGRQVLAMLDESPAAPWAATRPCRPMSTAT